MRSPISSDCEVTDLIRSIRVLLLVLAASGANGADSVHRPLIVVSGTAEILVAPDVVDIDLGVEIVLKDLSQGMSLQAARTRDTLEQLRRFGIEDKDVRTDHVSVQPVFQQKGGKRVVTGYTVRKDITVSLRELSRFEALTAEVLETGINRLGGIRFHVSDMRKHRDRAREMAVDAAREKAEALAARLGQKIGKAWRIEEEAASVNGGSGSRPSLSANTVVTFSRRSSDGEEITGFAPGQVKVEARVLVEFDLLQ